MKTSVIVIDDDPDITEVLSEFLRLRSINVLATGNNGKDAVELYQKYSPDVVLLDFMMPKYDGLYGLENIRKLDSNAKVIMLTGSVNYGIHEKLIESGVSVILQKPCDLGHLIEMIEKVPLTDSVQKKIQSVCNRI